MAWNFPQSANGESETRFDLNQNLDLFGYFQEVQLANNTTGHTEIHFLYGYLILSDVVVFLFWVVVIIADNWEIII